MPTEGKLYTMDMLNRIAQGEFDDDLSTANMIEAGVNPIRAEEFAVQPKRLAMDAGHPDYYRTESGRRQIRNSALSTPADVVAGIRPAERRASDRGGMIPSRRNIAGVLNEGYPGAPGEDYVKAIHFSLPEGYDGSERYMREADLSRRMGEPITEEVRLVEVKRDLESKLGNFKESRQRYFEESLPEGKGLYYGSPALTTTYAGMQPRTEGEDFRDMERALYQRYERVNENAEPYATEQPIEDIMQIYLDATKRRD